MAPPSSSALRKNTASGRRSSVSASARRMVRWMKADALPFWATRGWDAKRGGFHERFFFDGTPDDLTVRRVRVQWRQIYVLAHAAELGWHNGLKLAFQGLERLLEKAWAPDGAPGFAHVLAPDGSVVESERDPCDHAFAILALCWLAKSTGDAQVRALLNLVMDYCENVLSDTEGYFIEKPEGAVLHRQNPHMHMFEAMLAATEALAHPDAPARAARYRRMLEERFLDPDSGALIEELDANWRPVTMNGAALVEPGHMAEWAWLLRRHERQIGQKASPVATHLLGAALRAAEPQHGFLIDAIDTAQNVRSASRRLWPQTELTKAWLAQAEAGVERAEDAAEAIIEAMSGTYLSGPFPGGWIDKFGQDGAVAIDTVPASTLYHLFVATTEAERVLGV